MRGQFAEVGWICPGCPHSDGWVGPASRIHVGDVGKVRAAAWEVVNGVPVLEGGSRLPSR